MASKTGGSLKGIFDPVKKAAAAAEMERPARSPEPPLERASEASEEAWDSAERDEAGRSRARNRKAGGRNVRISGYIPPELEVALRDEVIRRTLAFRKTVSLNDVLCDALAFWQQHGAQLKDASSVESEPQ
jgi:hypothetical protein